MDQKQIDELAEALRRQGLTWNQTNFAVSLVRNAQTAERERCADAVSQAQRERNHAAQVRDAALSALFEVERLAGHDDAMTEWRDKWAHLWELREGPNAGSNRKTTA